MAYSLGSRNSEGPYPALPGALPYGEDWSVAGECDAGQKKAGVRWAESETIPLTSSFSGPRSSPNDFCLFCELTPPL